MTDEGTGASAPRGGSGSRTSPMEQFVLIVAFMAGFLILLDPVARQLTGQAVGAVFRPTIGFGGALPVLTILLASVVMVAVNTGVRHYFTDYLALARSQEVMKAFSREMKQARKDNNLHKMKKLTDKNQEIMRIQAEQSSSQMKPMALTMVVVIPIFAWLLIFADPGAEHPTAVAQPLPGAATGGWNVTLGDLERDFPTVAKAIRAPGRAVTGDAAEQARFAQALAERGVSRVTLVVPPIDRPQDFAVNYANTPCETSARVPWDARWCMDINVQAPIPLLNLFPRWVALYSLFSIPIGQVVSRWLKARDLEAELAQRQAAG